MATLLKCRLSWVNRAITVPWKGSMKQTRNVNGLTWLVRGSTVTAGFVDDGDTMGMPASSHTAEPAIEREDATSPNTAHTLSWLMSFLTMVVTCSVRLWLSSVTTRTGLPSTPPAALISSIASTTPLWLDVPKAPFSPDNEPYSPMTI